MTYEIHGHMLSNTDIDNPKNWPLYRKIYASSVAFAFAFVVSVPSPLPPPNCVPRPQYQLTPFLQRLRLNGIHSRHL
jgi:hypothetical protein